MCVLVVVVYVVVEKISLHLEREYNAREKEDSTPRFFCVVCVVCAFCPVLCAPIGLDAFLSKRKGDLDARARSLKGKSARNRTTTTTRGERERERQSARNIIDPPKRNDGRDGSAKVSANVDMSKSPPRQGFGFCDDDAFFVGEKKRA